MKAKIINKQAELYGMTFPVKEILLNKIAVVVVHGRSVDYGLSEVQLIDFGKEVAVFAEMGDSILRNTHVRRIAKRASVILKQRVCECEKALNLYVAGYNG